jgi:SAM-dependent methyltransferase
LIGVDLSINSLGKVRIRQPGARLINASNLFLPVRSGVASLILSEGVIHVTPNARTSFGELARILAPGGHLFVSVYNARNRYRRVYQSVGKVLRAIGSSSLGEAFLRRVIIPVWYVYYCYLRSLITRGSVSNLSLERSASLFYDRYMVPQLTFHTHEELEAWGRECGLQPLQNAVRGSMVEVLYARPSS